MKLRKIILAFSTIILTGMFACGVIILSGRLTFVKQKPYTVQQQKHQLESGTKYDGPVNLVLLGLDQEGIRTDTILFINFNPMNSELNILSVERDTKAYADGKYCKINALYAMGGEEYVMQIMEQITELPVHYYVTLNFEGFKKIIDVFGGVEFDVPFDMDYDDPTQNLHIHLNKGRQLLDGAKAEQLVRYRKGNRHGEGYIDGDVGRIQTQQKFLKELISQKLKLIYLSRINQLFAILDDNMKTNITISDVKYYLPGIAGINTEKVGTFTMAGDSSFEDGVWYFFYNKKKTLQIIKNNFSK